MTGKLLRPAPWTALVTVLALGTMAYAQLGLPKAGGAEEEAVELPEIEVDILAMLMQDQVFAPTITSDVWSFRPKEGKRLIQVPLIIKPSDSEVTLGSPAVGLKSARFVAWRVYDSIEKERNQTHKNKVFAFVYPAKIFLYDIDMNDDGSG